MDGISYRVLARNAYGQQRRFAGCFAGVLCALAWSGQARAQAPLGRGFSIDPVDTAPAGDRFLFTSEGRRERSTTELRRSAREDQEPVPEPCLDELNTCDNGLPSPPALPPSDDKRWDRRDLSIRTIYSYNPLRYSVENSGNGATGSSLWTHIGGSWSVVSWFMSWVDVPLVWYQSRYDKVDDYYALTGRYGESPGVGEVGDVRVGVRGGHPDIFRNKDYQLSLAASGWIPTGRQRTLTSDPPGRFDVTIPFSLQIREFFASVNVGWEHRVYQELGSAQNPVKIGSGFKGGVGLGVEASSFVDFTAEVRTSQLWSNRTVAAIGAVGARLRPCASARYAITGTVIGTPFSAPGMPAVAGELGLIYTPHPD